MTRTAEERQKFIVLSMLFVAWLIGNLDRMVINVAIIPIVDEFSLDPTAQGLILSSFFAGYALMQIPGGWLADKFGAAKILTISLFLWSIFTALTGSAWSLVSLILIRFLFGLGEAPFSPSSAVLISEHFPKDQRGRAQSTLLSASVIGKAITPVLASGIIVWLGWRSLFFAIGVAGLVVAVLCLFYLRSPERDRAAAANASTNKVPLKTLLKMPLLWSLLITSFGIYFVTWGMASWMPTYLVKVRHLDLLSMGALSTIPSITSFLSMIAGGVLLDRWLAGKEKGFVAACALLTAVFIYLMFNAPSVGMVILYETLSGITGTFIVIAVGLQPLKRFSQEVIGTAMGIVNFGGQAAGFVAPLLIGMTVKAFNGSYDVALWILVALMVVCAIAAMTWPTERKTTAATPASPTQAG